MWYKCGGKGGKAVYTPFHFRDPKTKEPLANGSGIAKLWSGMKKECCSDADNFALKFPTDSKIAQRKGLLGLNFLIDLVWFETHKKCFECSQVSLTTNNSEIMGPLLAQ